MTDDAPPTETHGHADAGASSGSSGLLAAVVSLLVRGYHRMCVGSTKQQGGDVLYLPAANDLGGASRGDARRMRPEDLRLLNRFDDARGRARVRIVCVSDTHGYHGCLTLPEADVLVVAGDILMSARFHSPAHSRAKLESFRAWCLRQPVKDVVVVAGNHDILLEEIGYKAAKALIEGTVTDAHYPRITYLQDTAATIQGLTFYGSPLSFGTSGNQAFQVRQKKTLMTGSGLDGIPDGVDVLVTHQPTTEGYVTDAVCRARPALHVGGHIHGMHGARAVDDVTLSITASIMNSKRKPTNLPVVVDL